MRWLSIALLACACSHAPSKPVDATPAIDAAIDAPAIDAPPRVSDNPPTPAGYKLMKQSEVTPDMTSWAVAILHDPATYPMFSTTTRMFPTLLVLARVEWHPPDFQNSAVHRGVTLYEPI